jgi:hypothetical protein
MKWFRNEEMLKGILEDNKKELNKLKENKYYYLLKDETNLIQDHLELMEEIEKLNKFIELLKDKTKLILKNDNGYYIECEKYGYIDLTQQEYDLFNEVLEEC